MVFDVKDFEVNDSTLPHVFIGGRCVYCNVNDLDADMYGPVTCPVVEGRVAVWSFGPDGVTGEAARFVPKWEEEEREAEELHAEFWARWDAEKAFKVDEI